MKKCLIVLSSLLVGSVALADAQVAQVAQTNFFTMIQAYAPHMIAFFIGVQIMLRGIAEGLTKISVITDNSTDNKIAAQLSNAAWIMGSILGKFGYSVPSEVIADKVDVAVAAKAKAPDGK